MTVVGRLVDAVTGQPVEGALLMLYDNYSDTVVRKSKPFYFGRSEKDGIARIENVREGSFKAFALVDKDQNYLFNQDIERVGFPDSLIQVSLAQNAPKLFAPDTFSFKKDENNANTSKLPKNQLPKDAPKKDNKADLTPQTPSSNLKIRLFDPVKKPILLSKETDKYGVVKLVMVYTI